MKSLKATKTINDATKETKKRKAGPEGKSVGKPKKFRATDPTQPGPSQPKNSSTSAAGPQVASELQSLPLSSSPTKLRAYFARRLNADISDNIASKAYEDWQTTHPTPTSRMCICDKSATYGTYKKGEMPQIAECVNTECRIRWYHYACLNVSDKGKARFGNLICQNCLNEQYFAEQDKKNGWSVAQLVDTKSPWSKADIEVEMPGLGGHAPVANPYGLGLDIKLGPMYKVSMAKPDTLGTLKAFGYLESRPYLLNEVYTNPNGHAELRITTGMDAEDAGQWLYETYEAEGKYDEMTDIGMEEEDLS
jgi:hypothetical protein